MNKVLNLTMILFVISLVSCTSEDKALDNFNMETKVHDNITTEVNDLHAELSIDNDYDKRDIDRSNGFISIQANGEEILLTQNVQLRQSPKEIIITGKTEKQSVILGIKGFSVGEYKGNAFLIGFQGHFQFDDYDATEFVITSYDSITGRIEGSFSGEGYRGDFSLLGKSKILPVR